MKVCHRCGDQKETNECYDIHISITERKNNRYGINQRFELCQKCKDTLVDRLSVVISDSLAYRHQNTLKKTKKTEVKLKPNKNNTKKK